MATMRGRANGAAIRVIRVRSGLTLQGLSDRLRELGYSAHPDYLSNVELGRKQPGLVLLTGIAQALACPLIALYAEPASESRAAS